MLKFIFYIFIFYVVMKILKIFVDPIFDKKVKSPGQTPIKNRPTEKPTVGEYIDYEEIR